MSFLATAPPTSRSPEVVDRLPDGLSDLIGLRRYLLQNLLIPVSLVQTICSQFFCTNNMKSGYALFNLIFCINVLYLAKIKFYLI